MDKVTKEIRSFVMSRIKGKNTKPEVLIFQALDDLGIVYKKHYRLLGTPDVVFHNKKVVVFIDGDFWHGWKFYLRKDKLPEYWVKKITRNTRRDRRYRAKLKREGWKVVRLWEHDVLKNLERSLAKVIKSVE